MRQPVSGAELPERKRLARPPCRDADDKKERFDRLQAEFRETPDEAGMERMVEAFWLWKKSGQDPRCLSIDGELTALEKDARRRIEQRKRADGLA